MLIKVNETECAVCHQPIPKDRVHYGGVSCYSCRAFFRRNTQREELPVCKRDDNCQITYTDRKQCSACRYASCLRIGMKPELVLTEDDKKRRFKKFLQKKETESIMAVEDVTSGSLSGGCLSSGSLSGGRSSSSSCSPPPLEPTHSKFANIMTASFQNNLKLLFANKGNNMNHINPIFPPHHLIPSPELKTEPLNLTQDYDNNKLFEDGPKLHPIPSPFSLLSSYAISKPESLQHPQQEYHHHHHSIPSPSKDSEAIKYFKSRGWCPPNQTLASPDDSRIFSVSPMNQAALFTIPNRMKMRESMEEMVSRKNIHGEDLTIHHPLGRKSVITFPSSLKVKSEYVVQSDNILDNPCGHEEKPFDSSFVEGDGPQNLSLKRRVSCDLDSETHNVDECKYVHKKFRTQEKQEDEEEDNQTKPFFRGNPPRQSVIMHAKNAY